MHTSEASWLILVIWLNYHQISFSSPTLILHGTDMYQIDVFRSKKEILDSFLLHPLSQLLCRLQKHIAWRLTLLIQGYHANFSILTKDPKESSKLCSTWNELCGGKGACDIHTMCLRMVWLLLCFFLKYFQLFFTNQIGDYFMLFVASGFKVALGLPTNGSLSKHQSVLQI